MADAASVGLDTAVGVQVGCCQSDAAVSYAAVSYAVVSYAVVSDAGSIRHGFNLGGAMVEVLAEAGRHQMDHHSRSLEFASFED